LTGKTGGSRGEYKKKIEVRDDREDREESEKMGYRRIGTGGDHEK
jgi:hypothetical protein